jgi:hypothetical protein
MATGKAYGLFDCSASKEEIERELPHIKDYTKTASDLCLMEMGELRDPDAVQIAEEINTGYGMKAIPTEYVLRATHPDTTNTGAAWELGDILNQAYQSPLFSEGEPFAGEVVYKEGEVYICRL